ncbi:endoplasmic reticulum resident protein 44 isoform X1 [Drosophila teissieri]|uniref:endoplasmic reticulum resident protein 44 isoform X1 n=1 Tax=Drosophila teissieri TaxID=7243 RepID=UPI001CBA08BA|nr:endoplasmic reticulum resident protein 44 isoform X1 [Drosophila teissieri]
MKVVGSLDILYLLAILVTQLSLVAGNSSVVVVTHENLQQIIDSNELVLLSFYTDWCRFSQILQPIFEEAAAKVLQKFPENGRVILGKVNCDIEDILADQFDILKYPTLKIIRNGLISNQEYRGQRSVEAFFQFVEKELSDPIKEFYSIDELKNVEVGYGIVIGYFISKDHVEYDNYRRVASLLRNDCRFLVGFGDLTKVLRPPGKNALIFRGDPSIPNHKNQYSEYLGNMTSFKELTFWIDKRCVPLVREVTFDNAEELSEEGLPFVLLFYNNDNVSPIQEFKNAIQSQLENETRVNFLTAEGKVFKHPLFHLGKSLTDLPLIAIDSFMHMYLFPRFKDIHKPGALKKFIDDLFSGALHINFHMALEAKENSESIIDHAEDPPIIHESKFKDLKPSKHRYTLVNRTRDEL